ncbi:MAG TPA: single-stranded DNA-binding protein [Candidatus Limnocylindrales bacterium]|nr:single-stranded DNA-binding protein [Candidatus Limnocylindrales bacterium]
MFDTPLTVVGNVLVAPTARRTVETNQLAVTFRVASNSRRFDKSTENWIDGQSLRVRVTCWRRLAEGVVASLHLGDPVIVTGRLYTRDWLDEQGNHRVVYEMDATAVGHDLARGVSQFKRNTPRLSTSAVEDEEAERRVGGEDSVPESIKAGDAADDATPAMANGRDENEDQGDLDDIEEQFRREGFELEQRELVAA